jgi:hypothetical protein
MRHGRYGVPHRAQKRIHYAGSIGLRPADENGLDIGIMRGQSQSRQRIATGVQAEKRIRKKCQIDGVNYLAASDTKRFTGSLITLPTR